MPRDNRSAWQASNGPKRNQGPIVTGIPAKRNPVATKPSDLRSQAQGRFAGSVVWGTLPSHPNKYSNLNNGTTGKPGVLNRMVDEDNAWATQAADPRITAQVEKYNQNDLTAVMSRLTVQHEPKTESAVPEWRRGEEKPIFPQPPPSRAESIYPRDKKQNFVSFPGASRAGTALTRNANNHRLGQNDRPFRGAATAMSCTYQRTSDQPRMEDARPDDYRPFFRHEFLLGTILRGIIHEQDFMGTPDPAMSQAPTNFTRADNRDFAPTAPTNIGNRHIGHGDWGPIYSENRFLIVVANLGDHYYAVPIYSHKGKGLAKKPHKTEYVSVADSRYPHNVLQQSAHRPITAKLKNGVDELLPMSAAYASYAVPRKYNLPVAHQGQLDEESTRRLVSMFHEWTNGDGNVV